MVNTILFQVDLMRFRKDFSACIYALKFGPFFAIVLPQSAVLSDFIDFIFNVTRELHVRC